MQQNKKIKNKNIQNKKWEHAHTQTHNRNGKHIIESFASLATNWNTGKDAQLLNVFSLSYDCALFRAMPELIVLVKIMYMAI